MTCSTLTLTLVSDHSECILGSGSDRQVGQASAVSGCDSVSESCVCVCAQGANLQGVKMLCTNAEGASLRGCNFEDPAGVKANLEGEAANHKPSIDKRTDTGCRGER